MKIWITWDDDGGATIWRARPEYASDEDGDGGWVPSNMDVDFTDVDCLDGLSSGKDSIKEIELGDLFGWNKIESWLYEEGENRE